jgi:hypothetical protein
MAGRDAGRLSGPTSAADAQHANAGKTQSARETGSNQSAATFSQCTCRRSIVSVWECAPFSFAAHPIAWLGATPES